MVSPLSVRDIFDVLKKAFEVVQDIRDAPKTIRRASRQIDRLHDRLKERLSVLGGRDGLSSKQLERIKSYLEDYMEDFDEAATITRKWIKHGSVTKGWDRFAAVFKAVFDTIRGEPKMLKDLARSIDKLCHNIHCELTDARAVASQIIFVCQPRNPTQLVSEYMFRQGMSLPQLALPFVQQLPSSSVSGLQLGSMALPMTNVSGAMASGYPVVAAEQPYSHVNSFPTPSPLNQITNINVNTTPWTANTNPGASINLQPSTSTCLPAPSYAPASRPHSNWNAGYLDQYPTSGFPQPAASTPQVPATQAFPGVAPPVQQNNVTPRVQPPQRSQNFPQRHPVYAGPNPACGHFWATPPFSPPPMHAQNNPDSVHLPTAVNPNPPRRRQITGSSHWPGHTNNISAPGTTSQPAPSGIDQIRSLPQPLPNSFPIQNQMPPSYAVQHEKAFQAPAQAAPRQANQIHASQQQVGPWQANQTSMVPINALPGNSLHNNPRSGLQARPYDAPITFPATRNAAQGPSFPRAPSANNGVYPRPQLCPNPTGFNSNTLPTHQSQAPHAMGVTGPSAQYQGAATNTGTTSPQTGLTATCSQAAGSTQFYNSNTASRQGDNTCGWNGPRATANSSQVSAMTGFSPSASWNQNYQPHYPTPMPTSVC